jgi:Omp85 superfamily domain
MAMFRVSIIVALLTAASAAAAQSQEPDQTSTTSRTALLAAEREKKATEVVPPQQSRVERALYRYDTSSTTLPIVFAPWHGVHLASGTFPAGAGTGIGLGFTHDLGPMRPGADPNRANRLELDTLAAYGIRGYSRIAAGLNLYRLGGAPFDVRIRGQHYEYPQEDFFGFGQDSSEDNRTSYLLRSTDVGAEVKWKAPKFVELGGGVTHLSATIGTGRDNRFPSADQLFTAVTVPGFVRQPDFVRGDATVALDWRDNPLHPHAGGRYGVQLSDYHDQDFAAFGFRRLVFDVQQYVPIPNRYRTIALHAAANFTDARDGQQVPFYHQPTLGGAQRLRGFRENRFQDQNSVLMTAEYRWEAWWALDGALFVDAGQVAANRRDFKLSDFDVSYGVGLRIHSNNAFVARLDLAFSREGFIPFLRFEHAF